MQTDDYNEMLNVEFARAEAIDAAVDALSQLGRGDSALKALIDAARETAIEAIGALVRVDPEDAKQVRELQWRVTRYEDLCTWVKEILDTGRAASEELTAEQAAQLAQELRSDEAFVEG